MASYVFEAQGKQFDPDGRANVGDTAAHNAKVEVIELDIWRAKPPMFVAYVTNDHVTTWLGTYLGSIVERSTYRNNLTGTRMEHIRVNGSNGATYFGSYGNEWSQAIRLRKCKSE